MFNNSSKTKDTFKASITFEYSEERLKGDPDDLIKIAELEAVVLDDYIVEALNDYFTRPDYKDLQVVVTPKFS